MRTPNPLIIVGAACVGIIGFAVLFGHKGPTAPYVPAEKTPVAILTPSPPLQVAVRERGDARSCIKVVALTWEDNHLEGGGLNRCDHEIDSVEIDLQLVKGDYIAESLVAFGSHVPPGGMFSFDEVSRHYAFDHEYHPFVAAVLER